MYLDRLLLLYQRLRRDRVFSKPALADADGEARDKSYCQVPFWVLVHCIDCCFLSYHSQNCTTIAVCTLAHKLFKTYAE